MIPGITNIAVLPCASLPRLMEPRSLAGKTYLYKDFADLPQECLPLYGEASLERNLTNTPQTRLDEVKLTFASDERLAAYASAGHLAFLLDYADGRHYLIGSDEHAPAVEVKYENGDARSGQRYEYEISVKGLYSLIQLV